MSDFYAEEKGFYDEKGRDGFHYEEVDFYQSDKIVPLINKVSWGLNHELRVLSGGFINPNKSQSVIEGATGTTPITLDTPAWNGSVEVYILATQSAIYGVQRWFEGIHYEQNLNASGAVASLVPLIAWPTGASVLIRYNTHYDYTDEDF